MFITQIEIRVLNPNSDIISCSFFYMLAQTTDSGSNNNTMASEMYSLLLGNDVNTTDGSNWDPTSMHIRCICHKFALIVNAGLASLALKTLPPARAKDSVLGFFPVLGRLIEEEEEEETGPSQPVKSPGDSVVTVTTDLPRINVESDSDYGNADDEGSDSEVANAKAPDHNDSSGDEASDIVAKETPTPVATTATSTNKHVKTSKLLELTNKVCSFLAPLFLWSLKVELNLYY
jgi:hypothetical protein